MTVSFESCPDVRLAEIDDVPAVMDLLCDGCAEKDNHPVDEDKIFYMVRRYFEKAGALLAVIGDVGSPVAVLLMSIEPIWSSPDYEIKELLNYVHPDHRKSDKAKQLIQFSKTASEGLSLDLTFGVLSTERTAAKIKLYERQFKSAGSYFKYTPVSAEQNAQG